MEFRRCQKVIAKDRGKPENSSLPQAVHSPRHADVPLLLLFPLVCMKSKHYVSTEPSLRFLPFLNNIQLQ